MPGPKERGRVRKLRRRKPPNVSRTHASITRIRSFTKRGRGTSLFHRTKTVLMSPRLHKSPSLELRVCPIAILTRSETTCRCSSAQGAVRPMAQVTFRDIEIDRCTQCNGLWFDALEHEHLRNSKVQNRLTWGPRIRRTRRRLSTLIVRSATRPCCGWWTISSRISGSNLVPFATASSSTPANSEISRSTASLNSSTTSFTSKPESSRVDVIPILRILCAPRSAACPEGGLLHLGRSDDNS